MAGFAIVSAFGCAFAFGPYNGVPDYGINYDSLCKIGVVQQTLPGQCKTIFTGDRCTVQLTLAGIVPAWDDASGLVCINPLYRQY